MKTTFSSSLALGATLSLLLVATALPVSAQEDTSDTDTKPAIERRQEKPDHPMLQDVTKSIEQISNGVIVTLTSTNANTVTLLQTQELPFAKDTKVTVSKENLTNGVKVTLTTADADTLAKLQNMGEMKEMREDHEAEKKEIRATYKEELKTLKTQQKSQRGEFRATLKDMKKSDSDELKALKAEHLATTADGLLQIAQKALEYKESLLAELQSTKADLITAGKESTPVIDQRIAYLTTAIVKGKEYIATAESATDDTAKKAAAKSAIDVLLGNPLKHYRKFIQEASQK